MQDYRDAGLRMVNLENFIHSLKLTWIFRIIKNGESDFILLFEKCLSPISKFVNFGANWPKSLIKKNKNEFWNDVFLSWAKLSETNKISNNNDILTTPLWHNPMISQNILYYPRWYEKGIRTVGDIVNNHGSVMSQPEIQGMFNIQRINFLEYYRIKIVVDNFIKKHRNSASFNFVQPCILNTLSFVLSGAKPSKYFYEKLNKCSSRLEMAFKKKWHDDLNLDFHDNEWRCLFGICFKQYKILTSSGSSIE